MNNPSLLDFANNPESPIYPPLRGQEPIKVSKTPGRNEKCPCGSGKKYKHCCIDKYVSDL